MEVRVQVFGMLADKLGKHEIQMDLEEPVTAGSITDALSRQFPDLAELADRVAVAVNMSYVQSDHPIESGDEIALIPPVSGGLAN